MRKIYLSLIITAGFLYACSGTKKVANSTPTISLDTTYIYAHKHQNDYQASETKYFNLINTKLDVSFNWEKQYLYGKATLTLSPYFYPQDSLILDAKGFTIHKVAILEKGQQISYEKGNKGIIFEDSVSGQMLTDSIPENQLLKYSYDGKKLKIKLNKPYTRKDTFKVFIDYTAKPNERKSHGSAAITSDKGLYFIDPLGKDSTQMPEIWTQGESQSNSAWFPTFDSPDFRTHEEINITVDTQYVSLSNGILLYSELNGDGTRTDHWKMNKPIAPYLFMMAVGKFAVVKDSWTKSSGKKIDVDFYVDPKYKKYAMHIFGHTPEMLSFFSKILGVEYPWSKYDQVVVEDYVSGAMENTTATVIGSFIEQTDRERIDNNFESDISHELFHHWFGDYVTCESWSNIPLNESFATYGEYLWLQHKYGNDAADYHLQNDAKDFFENENARDEPLIRYYYKPQNRENLFDVVTYQKGGTILNMLRATVGDSAFFHSLHYYLESNKLSSVEVANLRLAFEKITGRDLNWFFNEWFFKKGYPQLNITYGYNDSLKQAFVFVDQNQDLNENPLYKLKVAVDIYYNGKKERHFITIDKEHQVFAFKVPVKPDLINFDGQKMLLCKKDDHHTPQQWAFMYKNCPKYLDRYEAVQALGQDTSKLAHNIILTALHDKFWAIRLEAMKYVPKTVVNIGTTINWGDSLKIEDELINIAKSDKKSAVRSMAIRKLSTYYGTDAKIKKLLLTKLANDSSYLVISTALESLQNIDSSKAYQMALKMENAQNGRIINAVAGIFATMGDSTKNQFFLNKINAASTGGYYNYKLAENYGNFLERMPATIVKKALPTLKQHASTENAWWMRLAFIKALMSQQTRFKYRVQALEKQKDTSDLAESKDVLNQLNSIIDELKKKETNSRLKTYLGVSEN